jgi:magnesium transporter
VNGILNAVFPEYHMLIKEDITTPTRPKIDFYDNFIFLNIKTYPNNDFKTEQIGVIFGKSFIITFRKDNKEIDDLFTYFKTNKSSSDIVLYKIFEKVFDQYYRLLEKVDPMIENYENRSLKKPAPSLLREILTTKKEVLSMHRNLLHERDMVLELLRVETSRISSKAKIYLKDVRDDVIHLIDNNEMIRSGLASVIEIHLSNLSNNTNEVMKTLTVVASFVLIPTLIASIYGMNFRFMPEIHLFNGLGYPFALGLMGASVLGMYLWFKKKGWM